LCVWASKLDASLKAGSRQLSDELCRRYNARSPVLLKPKEMSPVFGHEVVRVSFVGQAEKFHIGKIARQAGRHIRLASVEGSSCRQVYNELKNLVIRPAVNFTDLGQE